MLCRLFLHLVQSIPDVIKFYQRTIVHRTLQSRIHFSDFHFYILRRRAAKTFFTKSNVHTDQSAVTAATSVPAQTSGESFTNTNTGLDRLHYIILCYKLLE